jgi:dienelactone hydrolase
MSSGPCPDCFSGSIHTDTPTGTTTTIHGLPTYVAEPENGAVPKGIIVFITDAFGWEFINNRLLCDRYAKKGGFLVYCPDFMNGESARPLLDPIVFISGNVADMCNYQIMQCRPLSSL